jgi:hypothetical protein
MGEPRFFSRDVTDDELAAEIAALREGCFPAWRLVGTATYQATRGAGSAMALHDFTRIWLEDGAGGATVVTLQRLPDGALWRRLAASDEEASSHAWP